MSPSRARVVAFTLASLIVPGCDSGLPRDKPSTTLTAELTLLAGESDSAGGVAWVVALDDTSGLVVGSFRIGIHYDTTALRFVGVRGTDSLFIAANDVGANVLVAGASAKGFSTGGWLALEFAPRSANATLASPTIEVLEIGGVMGGDLRERIVVKPAWSPR